MGDNNLIVKKKSHCSIADNGFIFLLFSNSAASRIKNLGIRV